MCRFSLNDAYSFVMTVASFRGHWHDLGCLVSGTHVSIYLKRECRMLTRLQGGNMPNVGSNMLIFTHVFQVTFIINCLLLSEANEK